MKKILLFLFILMSTLFSVSAFNVDDYFTNNLNDLSLNFALTSTGIDWSSAGDKLFIINNNNDRLYELSCSIPFVASSCINNNDYIVLSANSPYGLRFSDNGLYFYFIDNGLDQIRQYTCSSAYDVSTCSYTRARATTSETTPYGIELNNDGTKFYYVGGSADTIYEISCSSAYDISTCSSSSSKSISAQTTLPLSLRFLNEGINMLAIGQNRIFSYTCSTPYLISSCVYDSNFYDYNLLSYDFFINNYILNFIDQNNDKVITYSNIKFLILNPTQNQVFLNGDNISLNLQFFSTTNATYSLNGGSNVSLGTNINNFTGNIATSLDGLNTLTIHTNTSGSLEEQSVSFYVNPNAEFRFISSLDNSSITNFNFGSYSDNGTGVVLIPYSDLNLGSNTLEFSKSGFDITNYTFNVTLDTLFNQTFSVSPVTLFVKVYEYGQTTPLNFNVVIENSTNIQTYNSITELNKMYSEIPTGDIKLTVSSNGYSNGIFYNTLTPFTSLVFNVYLFPANSSNIVTFTITDFDTRNFLEDVTIEARAIVNNSETTIQQTKTSASGVSYLILDTLVDYNFYFSKEGYTQAVIESIPGVTSYNIRLKKEAISFAFVNGVNVRYFPQTEIVYKNTTYTYKAQVQGESITSTTYTLYDNLNNTIYTSSSTNPTGSSFEYAYNLPLSSNVTKLYQKIVYSINGNTFTDIKEYKVYTLSSTDIENILSFGQSTDEESQFIKFFVILIAYIITILIGMNFQFTQNYVSMLTLLPTVLFTWFGWIPLLYGTVIFIATIALYIGGNKRL